MTVIWEQVPVGLGQYQHISTQTAQSLGHPAPWLGALVSPTDIPGCDPHRHRAQATTPISLEAPCGKDRRVCSWSTYCPAGADCGQGPASRGDGDHLMAAFILNWNPTKWEMPADEILRAIETTSTGGEFAEHWSVGVRTGGISPGDRAFLLRQHVDRGIVASGHFTGGVFEGDHWDGSNRLANYAPIAWTTWLPAENRLPTEDLVAEVPGVAWDRLQASGTHVPETDSPELERLWEDHIKSIGRTPVVTPEEVHPGQTFPEGSVNQVMVNRYERDPRARQACIDHHGTTCAACDFDFGAVYGKFGEGFIHVHHLRPLADLPDDYEVDPIQDLVPVCPNCHAMVHRSSPPRSIAALRKLVRSAT